MHVKELTSGNCAAPKVVDGLSAVLIPLTFVVAVVRFVLRKPHIRTRIFRLLPYRSCNSTAEK